jgi:hypothetical protein
MNVALQRRRLFAVLTVTTACIILALVAVIGVFALHLGWMMWLFAGAMLAGFASHGWLILGVAREKPAIPSTEQG